MQRSRNWTTEEDIAGSQDHPLLSRYPEAYISAYEVNKFQEYTLSTGPVTGYRAIAKQTKLEGQVSRITYQINKPVETLSIGEVYQDYKQALQKARIEILASGLFSQSNVKKEVGGGGWIGVALRPNTFGGKSAANLLFAGTSTSGGTFSLVGKTTNAGKTTYVAIYGERHSERLVVCHVDIIEVKAAELGRVFADADFIGQSIADQGAVSIYGIQFDFDSSQIKPISKPSLTAIAEYLQAQPKVALYVVGHTDMKGNYAYNLKLSNDRAQAVVDALVNEHQIDRNRLEAHGMAFLAPKASNETEEGRALNRRTELVKRTQ
ncbi:MAG: OmpA family protein [Bacteroidota bacterium]